MSSFRTDAPAPGAMLADLRRQSSVLTALYARRAEFTRHGQQLAGRQPACWAAFGSGDGWFAARAAQDYARYTLGLAFTAASSLEMLAYTGSRAPAGGMASIAISMSGTADRTNQAARLLRSTGHPLLALTNGAGGDLAGIADDRVSLEVSDLAPFLTGTSKYTASLLGLMLLLEGAAGQPGAHWTGLLAGLPDLLARAETWASTIGAEIARQPVTGIRVLACGPNLATADYGMAKCIKVLRVPVWSDDVEEFAHRQFWSCPVSDLVVYLATDPAVARCAAASAEALGSMGMRTIAIDTADSPVLSAHHRLTLPACPAAVSPLLAAIPLQYLAYFLARALGGNPDASQEVSDPARFHAAQLLARRSELG